jgi:hypothetical protein
MYARVPRIPGFIDPRLFVHGGGLFVHDHDWGLFVHGGGLFVHDWGGDQQRTEKLQKSGLVLRVEFETNGNFAHGTSIEKMLLLTCLPKIIFCCRECQ